MKISYLLIAMLFCLSLTVQAQDIQISGKVSSAEDNSGLPGVNVVVKGSTIGTITDFDGNFTLKVPGAESTIVFSSVGYKAQEMVVGNNTRFDINMAPDVTALEELVVVGYGSVKKSDLTGAVASIKSEQIENLTINSVQQALAGQMPGVAVGTGSAAPGGGMSIRIRGSNSIGSNNEPLYVIDGFPIIASGGAIPSGSKGNTVSDNPLANINPNDIESIEVLKDASATAIYGSRGANGVVLITTKTGQAGKTNVTLDTYYGVQNVFRLYEVLDAPTYIAAANESAIANQGEIPFPDNTDFFGGGVDTDWQNEIYRTAPVQSYQLGITSGNEKSRMATSFGYFNQQGVVKESGFQRFSARVNADTKLNNVLTVGSNLMFSRVLNNRVPTEGHNNQNAGPTNAALVYRPTLPVIRPDGTYTQVSQDGSPTLQNNETENPVAQLYEIENTLTKDQLLGNTFLNFEIIPGLNLRTSVGVSLSNAKREYYATRNTNRGGRGNDGLAILSDAQVENFLNENTLTYDLDIGSIHQINALVGYTIQQESTTRSQIQNTNFPNDITRYNDIGAGTRDGGPTVWSSKSDWRMVSYLARLNYILLDKYLITGTIRSDGSSKFGKENRWATFPSIAAAWRINNEAFIQDVALITDLKLRASWGETGNSEIGSYRSQARFTTADYSYGGTVVPAFYPNSIANPELTWETTAQTNIGLDFGIYRNRFTLSVDWYDKETRDLLLGITLPRNTGQGSATANFGKVRNTGYEIALGADLFVQAFKWHMDFNLSHNKNEVTDIGELGQIFGNNFSGDFKWNQAALVTEGQPMGVFYGFVVDGVFDDAQDIATWQNGFQDDGVTQPGDKRYVDVVDPETGLADGQLTVEDRQVIGNPHPDFILGWNNRFQFGNFQLDMFWQGMFGHQIMNVQNWQLYGNSVSTRNIAVERYQNRWTPENPTAEWPRLGARQPVGDNVESWVIEDGDFMRLRNVTLSYKVPVFGVEWLQNARVYLSGDNLLLLTKYTGYDPDVNTMQRGGSNITLGADNGAYPSARVFKAGFNVTF